MSVTAPPTAESPTDHQQAYARRWWTLAVLCLSLLIVFGGNSTLNVALPTLARDLGATESQLQWVVASYSLVFAGLLFTAGALGDRFGRKGALQFGLAMFFLASLLASQATRRHADHRLPRGHGRRRRVHHAVDVVDPRERVPAGRTGQGDRDLGRPRPAWRDPSVPCSPASLLGHFWFGSGRSSCTSRSSRSRSSAAGSSCRSRAIPTRAGSIPSARSSRSSASRRSCTGSSRRPRRDGRHRRRSPRSPIAFVVLTVFVFWELHTDEPMLDMRYFRNPALQRRQRRHDARVPRHVRRDAADDAVLPARARLLAARRRGPASCRWRRSCSSSRRSPPGSSARFGANRSVGVRHAADRARLPALRAARARHTVLVHPGSRLAPLMTGHVAVDGADDRGDHVGGAAESCRRRVGDERRDAASSAPRSASRCSAASRRRSTPATWTTHSP